MTRRKRQTVHFTFKSHAGGEIVRHNRFGKRLKTIIFEAAAGRPINKIGKPVTEEEIRSALKKGGDTFDKTSLEELLKALKEGKNVVPVENIKERLESEVLRQRHLMIMANSDVARKSPTLENIRKYFISLAEEQQYRHQLIRRTVREEMEKGRIEARYGTAHSVLAKELERERVPTSKTMSSQVFGWNEIVMRKLLIGKKPEDIPSIEFKKGFVGHLNEQSDESIKSITGKNKEESNDADDRFYYVVETAMLNRLSEQQLNEIVRSKNLKLMFAFNGFPNAFKKPPTRKQLIELCFLKQLKDMS